MFMSENICTMVDLFDKAVAQGANNHCGNEVRRWRQDIEIYIETYIVDLLQVPLIMLKIVEKC